MGDVAALPCGHLRLDESGRITACNPWLADALGRPVAELVGQRVEALLTAAGRVFLYTHVMPTLRAIGSVSEVYLDLLDASAAPVPTLWNAVTEGPPGARVTDIAVMVVRQRAQFERALLAARKAAEEARREEARAVAEVGQLRRIESLATLAGGVAHDFNNLLCAILGNLQLVRGVLPPTHPATPWLVDTEAATQRAIELAAKMLSYSGRARFSFGPVALDTLLAGHLARVTARAPGVAELRAEAAPGVTVDGDPRQLELLVASLVENALEAAAAAPGAGPVTVTLHLATLEAADFATFHVGGKALPGRYAVFTVTDRGGGIPPSARERLFEPFSSDKGPGRGLGLATSLGVVRAHRGAIRVESANGLGTSVTVALPLRSASAVEPAVAPRAPRGTRVLVLDPERSVRTLLSRGLGRMGFEVVAAATLDAAREILAAGPAVTAAVVDSAGPAGLDHLRGLRAACPALPVLAVGLDEGTALDPAEGRTQPFPAPYTVLAMGHALHGLIAAAPPPADG